MALPTVDRQCVEALGDLRVMHERSRAERAAEIAGRFDFNAAMAGYCSLIRELAQNKPD